MQWIGTNEKELLPFIGKQTFSFLPFSVCYLPFN
jgi:hypothetical protein